LKNEDF